MGKHSYGVILDAGSSGTRVHIYSWPKIDVARNTSSKADLHRLPQLKTKNKKWTLKVKPGVSEYGDKPDRVGPGHLKELFDFAIDVVPKSEVRDTPIFFLATAGMRLLEKRPQKALLAEICRYAREYTEFSLPECSTHVQIISGETEGLYGWVAANYLVGGFDRPHDHQHGKGHHTYGFLDMGGASSQIAFAPNATETKKHSDDLKLVRLRNLDGDQSEYKVFVTTFLGYGANEARRRFTEQLEKSPSSVNSKELPDPCLPSGLKLTKDGKVIKTGSPEEQGSSTYLVGTGRFKECLKQTYPLLDKDASCADPPCLFHGIHVPAIDFDVNHFIGVSNFWHGTHDIFEMGHKDQAYDFKTYQNRVMEFCSKSWDDIKKDVQEKKVDEDEETAAETCFKASWLINMLHDGIGIPRAGLEGATDGAGVNGTKEVIQGAKQEGYLLPFQAVNKINDTEVSWTLGKMVLFASSQVPSKNANSLDVGIENNVPGRTGNTHNKGPQHPEEPVVKGDDLGNPFYKPDDDGGDYDDTDYLDYQEHVYEYGANNKIDMHHLLSAGNLRRTPGFVLFLVILSVIGILLCGRERRANAVRKLTGLCRRRRGRGGAIQLGRQSSISRLPFGLGGRREQKYEQMMMEEGDIPNPQDFELHNISVSEDEKDSQSSLGSSSSQASARRNHGSVTPRRTAAASPHIGAPYPDSLQGNMNVVAQGAVLGLGIDGSAGTDGRGSRAGSPTRWRTGTLPSLKENLD